MKETLEKIELISENKTLLYVEDNTGLRGNMSKLIGRVFKNIILAEDGEDGYNSFIENEPDIIITDLNMPKMNGFKMLKKIRATELDTRVIILSAHDSKEHLHKAIAFGVFRYLHKPAQLPELINAIYEALLSINKEEERRIFINQMQSVFNYQNSMVVMMHNKKFTLSNKRFLEFFDVNDLEDFNEKFQDIDSMLLEHNEFLYTTPDLTWQDNIILHPEELFHTKIKNSQGEMRHLILKSREVPDKDGYSILSFDDVTELNLMSLFDSKTAMSDKELKNKKSIFTFIQLVKDNSSKVKIRNFYKGLTIINPAVISKITEDEVTLKTAYPQLKIVNLTKFMTISSELFPKSIVCESIKNVDLDNQSITIDEMSFALRSSSDRAHIRLEADDNHKCTLFYKGKAVIGEVRVFDISEVSAKISINALPPGLKLGSVVKISMNFTVNSKITPVITDTKVYRIDKNKKSYFIVVLFKLDTYNNDNLTTYIANRQMNLIKEFKKLNIT